MFILSFILLFFSLLSVYFFILKNSMMAIILLEVMSFVVIFISSYTLISIMKPTVLLIFFCLFILESVLSIVILINLVASSGFDFVKMNLFSMA